MTESHATGALILLVAAGAGLRGWLELRQIAHLRAQRRMPPPAGWLCPERCRAALDGTAARTGLALAGGLAEAAMLVLLIAGGVAALDRLWQATGLPAAATAAALVTSVLVLRGTIRLGEQAVGAFVIDARLGLNRTTPALFMTDAVRKGLLTACRIMPLAAATAWLMATGEPLWWLWAWAVWFAVTIGQVWLRPMLAIRLFHAATPLCDPALAARLGALLARCGLRLEGVRVIDASRRSGRANASVCGLGAGKRILLHDTLLNRLEADEIEAVVAHEAGHARHRHIPQYLAGLGLAGFAAFVLLAALAPGLEPGVGIRLSLFVLVLPVAGLFLKPLAVRTIQGWEFQADAFAARQTSPAALARALARLCMLNATAPSADRAYAAFHAFHPDPAQRLARLRGE